MKIIDKFYGIETDLSPVGLIRDKNFSNYFCTPENAIILANLGVDGIHFCIIPKDNDLTLENSPVYVVSPMMSPYYVMVVAENIRMFLNLIISTRDAGALECAGYLPEEKYAEYLKTIPYDWKEATEAVVSLQNTFDLQKTDNVYNYIKNLQNNADLTAIKFSKEYYELVGE